MNFQVLIPAFARECSAARRGYGFLMAARARLAGRRGLARVGRWPDRVRLATGAMLLGAASLAAR